MFFLHYSLVIPEHLEQLVTLSISPPPNDVAEKLQYKYVYYMMMTGLFSFGYLLMLFFVPQGSLKVFKNMKSMKSL